MVLPSAGNGFWLGQSSRDKAPVAPQEIEETTTGDFIGHNDPISHEKYSFIAPKKRATQTILGKTEDAFGRYEITTYRELVSLSVALPSPQRKNHPDNAPFTTPPLPYPLFHLFPFPMFLHMGA